MKKRIVPVGPATKPSGDDVWLDLGVLAEVEISSEDPEYPIEGALVPGHDTGWRAAAPGQQLIRLRFSTPQKVTHIQLHFEETAVTRTQEYVLRWSPESDQPTSEVVRQQWNFSPTGATAEIEDHEVNLPTVAILELVITPSSESQAAIATLRRMRVR